MSEVKVSMDEQKKNNDQWNLHLQWSLQQWGGEAFMVGGHVEIGSLDAAPVEVGGHPINCQSCDWIILVGSLDARI